MIIFSGSIVLRKIEESVLSNGYGRANQGIEHDMNIMIHQWSLNVLTQLFVGRFGGCQMGARVGVCTVFSKKGSPHKEEFSNGPVMWLEVT